MKRIFVVHFLPLVFVLTAFFYLSGSEKINGFLFEKIKPNYSNASVEGTRYLPELNGNRQFEKFLLRTGKNHENIFLFGSSELTGSSDALAYRYISKHFKTQVVGVGEAGNQCFSIYCQLLASKHRLENAPVVIILSPGWFEGKPASGTTSAIYTKFVSPAMLNEIATDTSEACYNYTAQRFSAFYPDLNSPAAIHRKMYLDYKAGQHFVNRLCCYPLQAGNTLMNGNTQQHTTPAVVSKEKRFPITPESIYINWDSLLQAAETATLAQATNNAMGISNDYYSTHIHGKHATLHPVSRNRNVEMDDFQQLVRLLKTRKVRASFIILPMNAFYYQNLKDMNPVVEELTTTLAKEKFPYYNMFTADTTKYNKAMLSDVMHPSDYGWYRMNRFIIYNYQLNR